MKKRILACLLVVVMLAGILALPAAAEDTGDSGTVVQNDGGGTTGGGDTTGGGSTGGGDTTGGGSTGGGDTTGGGSTGGGDTTGGGTTGGGDTTGGGTTGGGDTTGGGSTGGGDTTGGGTTGGGDTTGGGTTGGGDTTGGGSTGGDDTTGGGTTGGGDTTGGGSTGGDDTTGGGTTGGSTGCTHEWYFVEVPPTCTEYGAKGYVCVKCEAVTNAEPIALAPHTYDHDCDPDCNVCKATREVKHKFSAGWDYNSTQHWHICTICKTEKSDVGSHYPGPAATEDKDQICLTCGKIMTRKLEHKHEWSKDWTSDETGHFHKCTDEECDEVEKVEGHVYDDKCDSDCNVCGYVTETAHSFDGAWMTDENGHWSACTVCGFTSDPVAHVAVSEATDTQAKLCAVCGYEMAPALLHTHAALEGWNYDADLHWHGCECGEKLEEAPHTWDEGTEAEEDLIYRCTICGAEQIEAGQAKKASGSIGITILLVVLVIALVGSVVALVVLLKMQKKDSKAGKFGK